MNLTKTSAIAEIVATVAIVVTLIYLGIQTHQLAEQTQQNTAALQTSVRQTTVQNDLAILLAAVEHPELWVNRLVEGLIEQVRTTDNDRQERRHILLA